MPWYVGWRIHRFTFMVMLLPYFILTLFVDCGCRDGGFKIAPLASEVPRYIDWPSCLAIMPYLLLHIFSVKKSEAYNLTLGSSCFLSIPRNPISYSISFHLACDIRNYYGKYTMHMLVYSFWCSSTHACIRKSWTSDMTMSSQSSQTSTNRQGQR